MTDLPSFSFPQESQLLAFGEKLAQAFQAYLAEKSENALVVYLNGDLGAGKTTLTRRIVQSFGHTGNVKSPTYTLVEEYALPPYQLYHFDLYRLADPEELEFMGIRDYFRPQTLCLLEWASKGEGVIPPADLVIHIDYEGEGRRIRLQSQSAAGDEILVKLQTNQTA